MSIQLTTILIESLVLLNPSIVVKDIEQVRTHLNNTLAELLGTISYGVFHSNEDIFVIAENSQITSGFIKSLNFRLGVAEEVLPRFLDQLLIDLKHSSINGEFEDFFAQLKLDGDRLILSKSPPDTNNIISKTNWTRACLYVP